MAANDPGTYVDSPGGKIQAVVPFYWNGTSYTASRGGSRTLYVTGTAVGNAADLNELTLQSYTLPAGTLANVGDIVRVTCGGVFGATTDTKNVRLKFDGAAALTQTGNLAATTRWWMQWMILKTGTGTQTIMGESQSNSTTSGTNNGLLNRTETNAIPIIVTGQNSTNSVANSVTCQMFMVEFIPAP